MQVMDGNVNGKLAFKSTVVGKSILYDIAVRQVETIRWKSFVRRRLGGMWLI